MRDSPGLAATRGRATGRGGKKRDRGGGMARTWEVTDRGEKSELPGLWDPGAQRVVVLFLEEG